LKKKEEKKKGPGLNYQKERTKNSRPADRACPNEKKEKRGKEKGKLRGIRIWI